MKSVIFDEKDIERFKKSDKAKYIIMGVATPSGLVLSCVLAYLNLDFAKLLETFSENIFNPEVLSKLMQIMQNWFIISGVFVVAALLLLVLYFVRNRKKSDEDALTWGETIFLTVELILISQVVIPLFTIIVVLAIAFLYLIFYSSILLKNIIGYVTYLFVLVVEKICGMSGITMTYGEFIGQENYSMFLTM